MSRQGQPWGSHVAQSPHLAPPSAPLSNARRGLRVDSTVPYTPGSANPFTMPVDFAMVTPTYTGLAAAVDWQISPPTACLSSSGSLIVPAGTVITNTPFATQVGFSLSIAGCYKHSFSHAPLAAAAQTRALNVPPLQLTGLLKVTQAGTYTFRLQSDDGSRLSVAGVTLANMDRPQGLTAATGSIYLTPGFKWIR